MKYKYKTMVLNTLKAWRIAERLQAQGWKVIQFNYASNTVIFEKALAGREQSRLDMVI